MGFTKKTEDRKQFIESMSALGINLEEIGESLLMIVQLFYFTIHNNVKAVDEILRSGIKPEACTYLGWTPLHIAVANGHQEMVNILTKFAPLWATSKNSVNRSPLLYVKEVTLAKQLIQQGSDVNEHVDSFDTPLNTAASEGNFDLVEFLIAKGAKFNDEPLHYAARSGCVKTGSYLLKMNPKSITSMDYDYYLPIHSAAEEGHQEFVRFLLLQGSPTSPADVNGNTPLHLAARYEKEAIVGMLSELPTCHLVAKNHQRKTLMAISMHQGDKKWHHEMTKSLKEQENAVKHDDGVFAPDKRLAAHS